jgi:hypothetical protein
MSNRHTISPFRQPFGYPQASEMDVLDDPDDDVYEPIEFVDEGDEF